MNRLNLYFIFRFFIFIGVTLAISFDVLADTIPDSKSKKEVALKELVVEGNYRMEIPGGIAFYPDRKSKKFATDAISLFEMMSIPELPYDAKNNTITDALGNPLYYFINGLEADKRALSSLNPKDVDRVEYYPTSSDAKFLGKQNIVNIVTKKYIIGGYTKATVYQAFMNLEGKYSFNSKFAYKKFTYDIYAGGQIYNTDNQSFINQSVYRDVEYLGNSYDQIVEDIDTKNQRIKKNSLSALLKANYSTNRFNINLIGGLNYENKPLNRYGASAIYTPLLSIGSQYQQFENNRHGTHTYLKANSTINLPNEQQLSVYISGQYARNSSNSCLIQSPLPTINNESNDSYYIGSVLADYSKQFNAKNSLNIMLHYGYQNNKSTYNGSYVGNTRYHSNDFIIEGDLSHNFNSSTTLSLGAGVTFNTRTMSGSNTYYNSPTASVKFRTKTGTKSTLTLSSTLNSYGYTSNVLTEAIVRNSELLWTKGNTKLKDRLWWQSSLSNQWILNRRVSLNISAIYTIIFNDDMETWEKLPGYDGLVTTLSNDFTTQMLKVGPYINVKLFGNKLYMNGRIYYEFLKTNRIYSRFNSSFNGSLGISWYDNNWYTGINIIPSSTKYEKIERLYDNWFYELRLGYVYKNFNFRLTAKNLFCSSLDKISKIESPLYLERKASYDGNNRNLLSLQIVYTVGYGKKVSHTFQRPEEMLGTGSLKIK